MSDQSTNGATDNDAATGDPATGLGRLGGPPPRRWGQRWLDHVESAKFLGGEDLDRGRSYAEHDWQLEVHIEAGQAETLARSGPRVTHEVSLKAPLLTNVELEIALGLIANSGARTAALLDREIDLHIMDEAAEAGVDLLPAPGTIETNCNCRNWGELCKHAAALAYLLGDAFDADPFDLLLFRGVSHAEVIERVTALRSAAEPEADEPRPDDAPTPVPPSQVIDAATAWDESVASVPLPLDAPARAGDLPDWGGAPPARSPFTAAGLATIGADGIARAFDFVTKQAPSYLDLDRSSDIARRGERALQAGNASRLATNAALTSHELRSRVVAWQIAGSPGVAVMDQTIDTLKINTRLQYRQGPDGRWFRFEKPTSRWAMTAGPFEDPALDAAFVAADEQDADTATDTPTDTASTP